jgi:hypothetical protein
VAKAFDATLNTLIDDHISDWAAFLAARCGVPPGPASVLDTDLSSTLQADRLFRINGPVPAAVHLELESSGRLGIPAELLRYNVAAHGIVELPVHSVVVLLRPKATATDLTGQFDVLGANGASYLTFRYTVLRVAGIVRGPARGRPRHRAAGVADERSRGRFTCRIWAIPGAVAGR